ncbi:MAG: hypothetical protein CMP54_03115 [Flavobacteriales bacterium]|nr:hypothetical protein [Flavobacteriales bacterium]|tara:strand:+ start:342 stop:890 length:549 start_codon:yes stop_codon:yes gene_type:complete
MFSQLKSKISHYFISKKIPNSIQKKRLVTLSEAKKIGILFDVNGDKSINEIKHLLKYFLDRKIDVHILGFINNRKKDITYISTIHFNYFNLNDVSLLDIPNSHKTNSFLDRKYDILINLSLVNSFQTKCLSLLSFAKYKIGIYDDDALCPYDLMFKLKLNSLNYFTKYLKEYLELINKNNEK